MKVLNNLTVQIHSTILMFEITHRMEQLHNVFQYPFTQLRYFYYYPQNVYVELSQLFHSEYFHLPLFERIGSVALVTTVVHTAVLSKRRQGVPGRPFVTLRNTLSRTVRRAARSPAIRMPEPLGPAGFPNTRSTPRTETARNVHCHLHSSR